MGSGFTDKILSSSSAHAKHWNNRHISTPNNKNVSAIEWLNFYHAHGEIQYVCRKYINTIIIVHPKTTTGKF